MYLTISLTTLVLALQLLAVHGALHQAEGRHSHTRRGEETPGSGGASRKEGQRLINWILGEKGVDGFRLDVIISLIVCVGLL